MKKSITIIVAAAENNAIGKDNNLIWSLPNDLKRFKKFWGVIPKIPIIQ